LRELGADGDSGGFTRQDVRELRRNVLCQAQRSAGSCGRPIGWTAGTRAVRGSSRAAGERAAVVCERRLCFGLSEVLWGQGLMLLKNFLRNIPYWVETDNSVQRAVDPGCRPRFQVSCQAAFAGSRPAEVRRASTRAVTRKSGP